MTLNTPGSSLGGLSCVPSERESLSVAGIRATSEHITRGVWTPDRLTELDPDDALAPLLL
jgi:hypothetical protein